ncbi:MAG: hypothetical protein HONBIEJF_00558 [Fimbriimonadaceae bacterium]|nr:hypothetical protein [Fimbriimonadaceae bacterium]
MSWALVAVALVTVQAGQRPDQALVPDDRLVIETALLHFYTEKGIKSKFIPGVSRVVMLHRWSPEKTGFLMEEQIDSELRPRKLPRELIRSLMARNQGKQEFDAIVRDWKPMKFNPRIEVGEYGSLMGRRRGPEALERRSLGVFDCYAPGYSRDKSTAVLRAGFSPSAHGAMATYLLKRKGSGWRVLWCKFSYFA